MGRNIVIYSGYDDSDYLAHHGVKGMKWGVRKAEFRDKWAKASSAQKRAATKYARQDYWTLRPTRLVKRVVRQFKDKDTRGLKIGGIATAVGSQALRNAAVKSAMNNNYKKAAALSIGAKAAEAASLGLGIGTLVRTQKKLRLDHLNGNADKRYEIDPRTMKKKYSR